MRLSKKLGIMGIVIIVLAVIGVGIWYIQTKPEFTGPVEINIDFSQDIYHIGDQMILNLTVLTEPGYSIQLPEIVPPEKVEQVMVGDAQVNKRWGIVQHTISYHFTTFEPGEYIFPEISIPYTTPDGEKAEWKTEPSILLVESLLNSQDSDIRDLKPLAEVPSDYMLYYLLVGLIMLIVIGVLIWHYFKKRQHNVETLSTPLPAHVVAYQRLAALETSDLLEEGQIDKYFTILSEIVREYIENRYTVKAREMTTQEFLEQALLRLKLSQQHQELLKDFLQHADLVKYARHIPEYEQIHQAFIKARNFVDETKIVEIEEGGEEVV